MDRARKRARVGGDADADAAAEWTFHGDQRLVGVCGDAGAATPLSLVAAGQRHVQIRSADAAATGVVGKLVALESGRWRLWRPQDGAARFYVGTPSDAAASGAVRVLDAHRMAFSEVPFRRLDDHGVAGPTGNIDGAFIDGDTGRAVVLIEHCDGEDNAGSVGQQQWRLWCWRQRGEWTTLVIPVRATNDSISGWDARFYTSPVLGRCLHLIGVVTSPETATATLISQLLAVEDDWAVLHTHQHTVPLPTMKLEDTDTVKIWLSPSLRWVLMLGEGGRRLTCFQLNPFDTTRASQCCTEVFEAAATDVAFYGDVVAVLFVNGSLRMMELPYLPDHALVRLDVKQRGKLGSIAQFSVTEKEMGSIPMVWNRLVWLPTQCQFLASCGSKTVRITINVDECSSAPSALIQETSTATTSAQRRGESTSSNDLHRRRRRSRTRVPADEFGVVSSPAPSNATVTNLLHSIRIILSHHDTRVVDQVFTMLSIVLQRVLRGLGLKIASCDDVPIQVGIMEMLVAQVVLTKYATIHSTSSKIVQAPTFFSRQERRLYYHEEMRRIASASSDIRIPWHVHRQNFLRCIADTLSNLVADTSFSEVARLGISTGGIERFSSIPTTTNAARVMKEIERHDLTGARYPPWLRVEATLAVFAITSEVLGRGRGQLILDLPTLAHLFRGSNRARLLNPVREDYVNRFLSLGSVNRHTAAIQEDRSVQIDLIRRIAVKIGVMAHLVRHCGADLQLLEFLYPSKRPKDKDEVSNRLSQAVSLQIAREALTQLASMFQSSPLFIISKACKQFDSTSTSSWISAAEQDVIAFESFIKLVFISTDLNAMSDELVTGYIKAASSTHALDAEEIELRRRLFRLSGVVMSHVKNLVASLRDPNPGERLSKIFRELFLFDKIWVSNSSGTHPPLRDILEYVNEASAEESDGQDRRFSIHGRVTGLHSISHLESSESDRSLESLAIYRFARTLAVVLWSFWIRERVSLCKEAIDCYRRSDRNGDVSEADADAARKLGHLAALCALHLKLVALHRDGTEEDEIMSLQLFFLEAATELNRKATCKVVAWAFSADAVSARHVRRFRAIQATAGVSSTDDTARYRHELRRAVRHTADDTESSERLPELDAFGTSCCDGNFQRLVWALLQRRFTVASAATKTTDKAPIKEILQSRPSTVDGMISRHEVVHLLQAQRLEIEEKMQRLKNVAEMNAENGARGSSAAHATMSAKPDAENEARLRRSVFTAGQDVHPEKYQVRDLDSRHRSHDSLTAADKQRTLTTHDLMMLRKGGSSQNVLKLLQLRKDAQEIKRHQSAPRMVGVLVKPLDAVPKPAPFDEKPDESDTRRVRKNREPAHVVPLRRERTAAADMLLLTSSNQHSKKTVPLSRRSFQLAIAPTDFHSAAGGEPPEYATTTIQCTETRTTSIQTDEIEQVPVEPTESVKREEPTLSPPCIEVQDEVLSVSVGTQSQERRSHPDETGNTQASMISDRFPVYVDLQSATNGKFLHVAPMKRSTSQSYLQRGHTRIVNPSLGDDNDSMPSSPAIAVAADVTPEPPSPTNEAHSQAQIMERRRHTYRTHFPPVKARLIRTSSDRSHSSGVGSFITLKSEMERMKMRLMELEDCARDLDDDFKVSHHTLENLGKGFGDDARPIIDAVANVVDTSKAAHDIPPTTLSLKATRDLDSARNLLEQIERLTTAEQTTR